MSDHVPPPVPFPVTPPAMPASAPAQSSGGMAIAALVLGILGLGVPVLGIVALILGIVALTRPSTRKGLAIAAIVCGGIGMVSSSMVILLPVLSRARAAAQRTACASNLRQVGMSLTQYAVRYNGYLPANYQTLFDAGVLPQQRRAVLCCTVSGSQFKFIAAGQRMSRINNSVVVYEPIDNHHRGINVLIGNGAVIWIPDPRATQAIRELESGQNPPPSLYEH